MADELTELFVFDPQQPAKNVFSKGVSYVIPLYQRGFAWKYKQITTLIEDIENFKVTAPSDSAKESSYYLGTLVVSKKIEPARIFYEVIDGQQRLTTLFLILSWLLHLVNKECDSCGALSSLKSLFSKGENDKNQTFLTFECRKHADETLEMIFEGREVGEETEELDKNLLDGQRIVEEYFASNSKEKAEKFFKKLASVKLYRIEIPEHTDFNRYFEIMNTRGEQLEQQDILKSQLIGYLQHGEWDKEGNAFAEIWDACSDMDGYVQMHFDDTKVREKLFGPSWDDYSFLKTALNTAFEPDNTVPGQDKTKSDGSSAADQAVAKTIKGIIFGDAPKNGDGSAAGVGNNSNGDPDDGGYFKSFISFPYFLLHVLKIYLSELNGSYKVSEITFTLDDQNLVDLFDYEIYNAIKDEKIINKLTEQSKKEESFCKAQKISEDVALAAFVKGFIECLLKCRYLFDKYIIKRYFLNNDDKIGSWSIKTLKANDKNKPTKFSHTVFNSSDGDQHKRILMLESCLRVSISSPKSMHWFTEILGWLYQDKNRAAPGNLARFIEDLICYGSENDLSGRVTVKGYLEYDNYDLGVSTPHLVFNYLDYLLWKEKPQIYKINYDHFAFEYRYSVEHWYPQNPPKGTIPKWPREEGLDNFGNLCLVSQSRNSRYSNRSPEAKQDDFFNGKNSENASLKLRIMAEKIKDLRKDDSKGNANEQWKNGACKQHGIEMLNILRKACGLPEQNCRQTYTCNV